MRDLIQSRSVWRAVLPHAIANRLAKRALEFIPKDTLVQRFLSSNSDRLIKSFTRRLSFLHDCETAVEIVNDWLGQDGLIGKSINSLNRLGIEILRNIAPVSPEKILDAIERAANGCRGDSFTSRENSHHNEFVRLLRHLAYEPALFDRSVELLCRYARSESKNENNNPTRDILKSLFYIYLSGTHASVEARARIIERLTDSEEQDKQELGLLLLDAALEAWHFSPSHEFDFGARPRDYGYYPKTREEIIRWFDTFIGICTRLALSDQPIAEQARKLLAGKLRGLWTKGGMFEALEEAARQIQGQSAWNDGWIAVREIIRYDGKGFDEEIGERLHRLEKLLKPVDLLEQARPFALSDQYRAFALEDDFDNDDAYAGWYRAEETTRKIGAQVAQHADTLGVLLPDLVSTNNTRLHSFGQGLADGCSDKQDLLQRLRTALAKTPPKKRQFNVIRGFLSSCAKSDPSFYNATLDDLIGDDVLGPCFPILQTTSTIDQRGVERLHEALELGKAQIHMFQHLAGRAHEFINDDELARLLRKVISKEGGVDVAFEILQMRFHGRNEDSPPCSDKLMAVARDILSIYDFDKKRGSQSYRDYQLAEVARTCLKGQDGSRTATQIGQHLAQAMMNHRIYAFDYPNLLKSLAHTQPIVFLDVFLGDNDIEDQLRKRICSVYFERRDNPLNQISDNELLSWCEHDASVRYPRVALVLEAFKKSDETGRLEWKPVVYAIFERAPELEAVLVHLSDGIKPMSGSGSRADVLLSRTVLFQELYDHDNAEIRAWARSQYSGLQEAIKREREREDQQNRGWNERFE